MLHLHEQIGTTSMSAGNVWDLIPVSAGGAKHCPTWTVQDRTGSSHSYTGQQQISYTDQLQISYMDQLHRYTQQNTQYSFQGHTEAQQTQVQQTQGQDT